MSLHWKQLVLCGLASAWAAAAPASTTTHVIGAPQLGPVERPAKPLILVMRAVPKSQPDTGAMTFLLNNMSDSRYMKAAGRAAQAIKTAFPNLDLESEIRRAYRCGEPGSLCSELAHFSPPDDQVGDPLREFMRAREWTDVRVLSFWWEQESNEVAARVALADLRYDEGTDKPISRQAVLAGYYIKAPPRPRKGEEPTSTDEWEAGAPLPREKAIHEAIVGTEPLLQTAVSWAANTDGFDPFKRLPMIRKVRKQGIACNSMRQCNGLVEGIVEDRTWAWMIMGQPTDRNSGFYVWELQSRSRTDP